jgi:hypothetical protein
MEERYLNTGSGDRRDWSPGAASARPAAAARRVTTARTAPRRSAPALLLLIVVAVSACARATEPAAPPAPPARAATAGTTHVRFLQLYRGYGSDYDPASTVTELARRSEVVAVGRLKEIREGRILGSARDDPGRTEHLLYVFNVIETPKGALRSKIAYVEAPKPSLAPATSFDAAAPKGAKALLYLRFASPTARGESSFAAPNPLPPGEPLLSFTTPQGFLIHTGGRVAHPLASGRPSQPLFTAVDPRPTDLRAWLPPGLTGRPP